MPRRSHAATARSLGALVIATGALAVPASATYAATPTPPFTECPSIGADPSCQLLIDITPTGTTVTADPASPGPYDGSDDTLIGLKNDSTGNVSSIPLSSTTLDIFGFDGDGICTFLPFAGSAGCPFDSTGYGGPGVSYSGYTANPMTGVVNFTPAIPPGGTAYFSLEDAIAPSTITVAPPAAPPTATIVTPNGGTYTVGDVVDASYSCAPGAGGTLTSCAGTVADGSPIDTTTAGTHSFAVTATDADTQTYTATSTYNVNKAPTYLTAPPLVLHVLPGNRVAAFEVDATLTSGSAHLPLAGESIAFTAGSTKLCSGTTNVAGKATCTYSLGGLLASVLAPLTYTATFAGDANHVGTSVKAPIVEVLQLGLL
jgi:hypothetical protein